MFTRMQAWEMYVNARRRQNFAKQDGKVAFKGPGRTICYRVATSKDVAQIAALVKRIEAWIEGKFPEPPPQPCKC